jgi:hypothetical protein
MNFDLAADIAREDNIVIESAVEDSLYTIG